MSDWLFLLKGRDLLKTAPMLSFSSTSPVSGFDVMALLQILRNRHISQNNLFFLFVCFHQTALNSKLCTKFTKQTPLHQMWQQSQVGDDGLIYLFTHFYISPAACRRTQSLTQHAGMKGCEKVRNKAAVWPEKSLQNIHPGKCVIMKKHKLLAFTVAGFIL